MVVTFILVNVSSVQEGKALVRLCVNAGLSEPRLFSSRIKVLSLAINYEKRSSVIAFHL